MCAQEPCAMMLHGFTTNPVRAVARMAGLRREIRLVRMLRAQSSPEYLRISRRMRAGSWLLVEARSRVHGRRIPVGLIHEDSRKEAPKRVNLHNAAVHPECFIAPFAADPHARLSWSTEEESFAADVVLFRASGTTVCIDLRRKQVQHLLGRPLAEEHLALRERFARYVPSPDFAFLEQGNVVSERFVEGTPIDAVSPPQRVDAVIKLLEGIGRSARAASQSEPREAEHLDTREVFRRSPLPEAAHHQAELLRLVGPSVLLVPVHGDLGARNILWVEEDQRPSVIDFGTLGSGPVLVDALKLVTDLPDALKRGQFDRELAEIWSAMNWDFDAEYLAKSGRIYLLEAIFQADYRISRTARPMRRAKQVIKSRDEARRWAMKRKEASGTA